MGDRDLSSLEITYLHFTSILKSIARLLLKRKKRTASKVAGEYDDGHWKRALDEKKWLKFQTLDQYLYSFDGRYIKCKMNSKFTYTNNIQYYRYRNLELTNLLKLNFKSTDNIVELGSGSGYNVFALALHLPECHLTGLDISPNGVQAGREIAEHFKLSDRVKFDILDLTDSNHAGFNHITGKNCFSFFCLEQLPYSIEKVIRNIASAKPSRVLHIEPSSELLSWLRPSDWCNYIYIKSVDYQTQLLTILKKLHSEKSLFLLNIGEVNFAPIIHTRGFLGVWEPK